VSSFPEALDESYVGQVLDGRYEVRALIGRGGMGSVYRALHGPLRREVAVKILTSAEGTNPERLIREARAASAIQHARVVKVHDVALLDDGTPFLVMELLDGESLDHRLAEQGALSVIDAIDLTMQLLDGLEAVHAQGVVHRDIKPGNVFLLRGEHLRVKLLDFGLSSFSNASRLTMTGEIVGTTKYLAPEQARGVQDPDARVDVWATGILLYEMLVGRTPFEDPSVAATVTNIVMEAAPPPSASRGDLPKALDRVIEMALAKDRDQRYQSAEAMYLALERIRRRLGDDTMVDGEAVDPSTLGVEAATLVDDEPPAPDPLAQTQHDGDPDR